MTQVISALRVMGTLLLAVTEIVLVALFAVGVAGMTETRGDLAACLLLHCVASLLVWGTEGYILVKRGRDPSDITYVALGSVLAVATGMAFVIYAVYIAHQMPFWSPPSDNSSAPVDQGVDFGGMGSAAAYAVLILSWLVTLLSIQSLIFAVIEKLRSRRLSPQPRKTASSEKSQHGSFIRHRQPKVRSKPTRGKDVDWDQRPLPITIIAVDHTTAVRGSPPSGWKITEVWEESGPMSPQEEAMSMTVSDGDETLVHVPLSPMRAHADLDPSKQV